MDPYTKLQHYRTAIKLLKCFGDERGRILVVGNKHNMGFEYAKRFPGLQLTQSGLDEATISSASAKYDMILCLDSVLYVRALHKCHLPVMTVATAGEIHDHPEILESCDYLLPAPEGRADLALQALLMKEIDDVQRPGASPAGMGSDESMDGNHSPGGSDPSEPSLGEQLAEKASATGSLFENTPAAQWAASQSIRGSFKGRGKGGGGQGLAHGFAREGGKGKGRGGVARAPGSAF